MTDSPTDSAQQVILIPALPATGLESASGAARTVKPKHHRTTAARRASHNAVERLRRENLNGRFLDLASMLPNLATIRRPSKSSIVNSCIAHVHASRRHRFMASHQVQLLAEECDSLRREVNEWRERIGGIMLLPPPNRGEIFAMVLAGAEFELEDGEPGSGEGEEEDYGDEDGGRYTPEELARLELYHQQQQQLQYAHAQAQYHSQYQSPFAHNIPTPPSTHSAEFSDHSTSWHDEHPWHDDRRHAPQSAHEPVMRHPYMPRPQTQPPLSPLFPAPEYAPYDPLGHYQLPHGPSQYSLLPDEQPPKWEFVAQDQPIRRVHRQSTR
ncbi:hypothetical protein DFH06DRAFT_1149229 [Mycena polygramma]|nr:hypothetical protein DFH06DRAFT_1149229 [Mycena polygramma]